MGRKKIDRQELILEILKSQGTGVINISNQKLGLLAGCSRNTIHNDITEMDGTRLIVRETNLIRINGETRKQRDIILKKEIARRFTIRQHKNLADKRNHRIYTNEFDEVIWERKPDGRKWCRNLVEKEFYSEKQAYAWLYSAMAHHFKKYTGGDQYVSRTGIR